MPSALQTRRFSFLTAGPGFSFRLPEDFEPMPYLSTPLSNGRGPRSFDFVPASRDSGVADGDGDFVRTVPGRDGRPVELYYRPDSEEPLWWLRWKLPNGSIYTHLRREDGEEMVDVTVASISIADDDPGVPPFVLPDPPLIFAGSAAAGYQEEVLFLASARGPNWSVHFKRPGFMPQGKVVMTPRQNTGGRVLYRAGVGNGLELRISAGNDERGGQEVLSAVKDSFVEN